MSAGALWTSDDIASACGTRATGSWTVSGVSIDSRTVVPGDLFVALVGPNFDGHDFVGRALDAGAGGAVVHRRPGNLSPSLDHKLITVKDTLTALQDLARAARRRSAARIVAVTGSVGKTGTKDMLRHGLGAQAPTHATAGNLNNHWGVPLTLARLPRDARYAVIEIGMNHAGEIAPLATMARPHAAIVTAVEPAHLAFFDSLRDIAAEKASIVRGVVPDGTFVIPADNAEIETLRKVGQAAGVATIVTFGAHEDANLRLVDAAVNLSGTQVVAEIDGARLHYDIGIAGRHVALNSLAAVAAVRALGADVGAFVAHLALLRPTPGRGDRRTVAAPGGPITVIDESYNASPAAVLAVAEAMAAAPRAAGMRLILVLGDMLELGVDAAKLHAGLAPRLAELRIDSVYTAGPLMENLHLALPKAMRGGHARDSLALTALVSAALRPGDVVAVKGSHGSNMKPVVEAIAALGAGSPPARAAHGH